MREDIPTSVILTYSVFQKGIAQQIWNCIISNHFGSFYSQLFFSYWSFPEKEGQPFHPVSGWERVYS